jgi:hypothetical protein
LDSEINRIKNVAKEIDENNILARLDALEKKKGV